MIALRLESPSQCCGTAAEDEPEAASPARCCRSFMLRWLLGQDALATAKASVSLVQHGLMRSHLC